MSKFLCDTRSLPHTALHFLSAGLQLGLVMAWEELRHLGGMLSSEKVHGKLGGRYFLSQNWESWRAFFFLLTLFCFSSGSLLCLFHKRTQNCDSFISERLWYQKEHPLLGKMIFPFTAAAAKSLQSCPTLRPQRRQPIRLPRPWDSLGKNTGVGCHFFLQCMKVKSESQVAQSCPTLRDPMDCSLPGSSTYGIFQARVLEWGAIAFSSHSLV